MTVVGPPRARLRVQPSHAARRAAGTSFRRATVGRLAGAGLIQDDEGLHLGFTRRNGFQTALEIGPRRVGAVAKARRAIVKDQGFECPWIVAH